MHFTEWKPLMNAPQTELGGTQESQDLGNQSEALQSATWAGLASHSASWAVMVTATAEYGLMISRSLI